MDIKSVVDAFRYGNGFKGLKFNLLPILGKLVR